MWLVFRNASGQIVLANDRGADGPLSLAMSIESRRQRGYKVERLDQGATWEFTSPDGEVTVASIEPEDPRTPTDQG